MTDEVTFEVVDPAGDDAQACLRRYYEDLDARFDGGFDVERSLAVGLDETRPPAGVFLVARDAAGEPVGCGAVKAHGEIKRMWVSPTARGCGLGRRLLAELERHAAAFGATSVRLDTNRALVEAIALYRSSGYVEIEPFTAEPYAHHWFEKRLDG